MFYKVIILSVNFLSSEIFHVSILSLFYGSYLYKWLILSIEKTKTHSGWESIVSGYVCEGGSIGNWHVSQWTRWRAPSTHLKLFPDENHTKETNNNNNESHNSRQHKSTENFLSLWQMNHISPPDVDYQNCRIFGFVSWDLDLQQVLSLLYFHTWNYSYSISFLGLEVWRV